MAEVRSRRARGMSDTYRHLAHILHNIGRTPLLDMSARTRVNHSPELRARSIVSLIDHLPKSTSTGGGWLNVSGDAFSKFAKSPLILPAGEVFVAAFFASARLSAICSRILSWGLGEGGISSSAGSGGGRRAGDLVGDRVAGLTFLRLGCERKVCWRGLGVGAAD